MDQKTPRHEKIRFRRDEIARLETLPSAAGQESWAPRRPRRSRVLRVAAWLATLTTTLVVAAVAAVYLLGTFGISTDGVRDEAEAAIEAAIGMDVDATFGPARLSFDHSRFLAVDVGDVTIRSTADGATVVEAGSLSFDVRLWSLFAGRLELGGVRLADATVSPSALPSRDETDWAAGLRGDSGLISPDLVGTAVFASLHGAMDALDRGTQTLELDNVRFLLPEGGQVRTVTIKDATLSAPLAGELILSVAAEVDDRLVAVTGAARRVDTSRRISELDLTIDIAASTADVVAVSQPTPGEPQRSVVGPLQLALTGAEGIGGEASRLALAAKADDLTIALGNGHDVAGSISLAATMTSGTGKVEIERLRVLTGRSQYEFHGAVGPKPDPRTGEPPAYRFELVSDGSTVSPDKSPEPALSIVARVAGWYEASRQRLVVEDFGVRSRGGEMLGTADFEFGGEGSPGIFIAVTVPEMPVSHVKQLWPSIAASGARRWAMNNMFGGVVTDSSLQYHVAPGRLGNGVPLSREEVSGRFVVDGTRFDITGGIPPVRDASGIINFGGNDVDVVLSAGTVYMPSGRFVNASDGTLQIHNANQPRVVGRLDMNVAGSADAVTELASYEPINAMKRTGMVPDDFQGDMAGNVKADIPLFGNFKDVDLPWLVALDFKGLALGPPLEGQKVTEAVGTIVVDPDKAVIKAKTMLNGAPAEVDIVEPFAPGAKGRKRDVTLVLDDKARSTLVSGLDGLLSGPVKVKFEAATADTRRIEADLTDAKLDIPWAGWSKGAGVAATVVFDLDIDGSTSRLSDFELTGKSFAVKGEVTLVKGSLSSANFGSVQLNRGDNVSLTIKRSGKGYVIVARGKSFDARSIIRRYVSEDGAAATADGGSTTVAVTMDVDALTGFHGETISGARLTVAATGDRIDSLTASAASDGGGAMNVRNGEEGGRKYIELQASDAGSFLRFLDIYQHMEGGTARLAMTGTSKGAMSGQVDVTNFWVVNEPKLASIVAKPLPGDQKSLNQAVRGDMDVTRAKFDRGYAVLEKRAGFLALERGVLRGPLIGSTFQGTLYDEQGNMDMTGTFMPAYGLNRIFGEIPLVGLILGNGRDRGLIGVTYRLSGKAAQPRLQINPLSVIAPGIFRSIFEFR